MLSCKTLYCVTEGGKKSPGGSNFTTVLISQWGVGKDESLLFTNTLNLLEYMAQIRSTINMYSMNRLSNYIFTFFFHGYPFDLLKYLNAGKQPPG